MTDHELQLKAVVLRRAMLQLIVNAGAGHTGGGLSCLDILNVLYNRVLRVSPRTIADPHRDRYVQSKGHCVEALYTVLADRGFFPGSDLETVCRYQSPYVGHPTRHIPGIEMNTGALGHGLPISVGMALAGKLDGALGTTHHSLHDLAVLRAINNLTILVPADNFESSQAIRASAQATKPVFVRFGKAAMYAVHPPETNFEIGRAITVRPGHDLAFIATGETVIHALLASARCAQFGLQARVISLHTIKPLDTGAILQAGRDCRAVITVEEHSIHGGLGEACAATLMQAGVKKPFRIIGIPDEETVPGSQADIFRQYGISMEGLTDTALNLTTKSI